MRLILSMLICCCASLAHAQLQFTEVPGTENGATQIVEQWRSDTIAAGGAWWSWGTLLFTDEAGDSYLHLANHRIDAGSKLLRYDASINLWVDVTPFPSGPQENRPLYFQFDNQGGKDLIHTGDESNGKSWLKDAAWSETFAKPGFGGIVTDYDLNGFKDVVATGGGYGISTQRIAFNNGAAFTNSESIIPIPSDLPQSVKDTLLLFENDGTTQNRFCSPKYWHGDLDGLNGSDTIVSYYGSYADAAHRWNAVCLRDENGDLQVATGVASDVAVIFPPVDINGDGLLDLLTQWGGVTNGVANAGIYYQDALFGFVQGGQGDEHVLGSWLKTASAPYLAEYWDRDFDGDGDSDLLISNKRLGKAHLYENQGGVLSLYLTINHCDGEGASVGDYDGDGDIDIAVWGPGSGPNGWPIPQSTTDITFYRNDGVGVPPPPSSSLSVTVDGAPYATGTTVKVIVNGVDVTETLLEDNDVIVEIASP